MPESAEIYSFALQLPVYHCFDYKLSPEIDARPGQRYLLPFAQGYKLGLLISKVTHSEVTPGSLKAVEQCLDEEPLLSAHLLKLAQWIADYYCQPIGEVIFLMIPRYCRQQHVLNATEVLWWRANPEIDINLEQLKHRAPRQFQIMTALMDATQGLNASQLKQIHSHWHQQVKALQKKGWVQSHWMENLPVNDQALEKGPELTSQQVQVSNAILPQMKKFGVQVIQGVTGSGKTEIYMQLMQYILEGDQQVIYLVPEIGLTPQLIDRIRRRLGSGIVSTHSGQTDFQRYQSWDQCKRGVARVLIGTRSALFSEAPNLGLIIVDEEHDMSFRQQDGVRYHARDVAIKRAQMLDIPVILGSATPSIDTLYNLGRPHYHLHELPQRPNQTQPPTIERVDCKHTPLNTGCSPRLLQAIERHLNNHGQVLLFLNRRGYAPVIMCYECGWQAECHQCDARLTLHQSVNKLICHHCGYQQVVPTACPECGKKEIQHLGVGTQQLEAFLKQRFTRFQTIRIDRDSVKSATEIEHRLAPVAAGEPCILVGTQMLAKGHDYPNITLVGILDADQALFSSFYRAPERLVQTVLQVSGRAGRANKPGEALLQTAFPSHPLIQGLCHASYRELAEGILKERQLLNFPPYSRVVTFLADAIDLDSAMQRLRKLVDPIQRCSVNAELSIVGPIPALMTRRVGRYRAQLSILAVNFQTIRHMLREIMPVIVADKNTVKSRVVIEVDPQEL